MKEEEEIHTHSTLTHTHTETLCLSLAYHSTHGSPEEDFSLPRLDSPGWGGALSLSISTPLKHGLREDPSAGLGLGSGDKLCLAKASQFIGKWRGSRWLSLDKLQSISPTLNHSINSTLLCLPLCWLWWSPYHMALSSIITWLTLGDLSSHVTWLHMGTHGYGPNNSPPPCPWEENVFW